MSNLMQNKAYINGEWVSALSGKTFDVKNPANGQLVGTVPDMNADDTQKAIEAASEAYKTWGKTTGKERSDVMRKWYEVLNANSEKLEKILIEEGGKLPMEAKFEVIGGIEFLGWYAEEAKRIEGEIVSSPVPNKKLLVEREPLGVVGLVTPWNAPFSMITRKGAAALAAGCTFVLKPAEDTPLIALATAELAHEAGIPKGVINVVTCDRPNAPAVGKLLCESPIVRGISFTGSTAVGKILYQQCAPHIKRVALELGGNSPFIVFKTADLDLATDVGTMSKFIICGQGCILPNRYLIHEDVYDAFAEKLKEKMKNYKPGVSLGPLINITQVKRLDGLVESARKEGVDVVLGGRIASEVGEQYYEPTLITGLKPGMRIYKEEIFGPVICLMKFKTEEEAIQIANDTEKGLASHFFSQDASQIFRVSRALESGMVFANTMMTIPPNAPFGGIKESGIGKEGVQEIDGGFFEKFGSLFREQTEAAKEQEQKEAEEVLKIKEAQTKADADEDDDEEIKTMDSDEGVETESESPVSSDTEQDIKAQLISCALNIEELYIELLYIILHNVGHSDVNFEIGETALFSYLQDAFKLSNEKHQELYEIAVRKEPPDMLLNVEVIEAKDLVPKDPNGLSDPFVTLYLASNSSQRYNSSVKPATLNPLWEEHFALPMPENHTDDTLCIEVWDFDPAETVGEKFGKFFEAKGVKGIRRLVKEIAVTATTGQHNNEFIGKALIPLNAIPATGMKMWYSLDKKNRDARRGVIKLRLGFSSEKNCQVAAQEHKHLLRILLLHELEKSKVAPFWWCGNFSAQAESLIVQHVAQSGLSPNDTALAQWIVYINIHKTHPLSFDLFANILEKLVKPIQTGTLSAEDQKLFWSATSKLLPSCFTLLRKIRKTNFKEKNSMKQISRVLSLLATIGVLDSPESIHKDLLEAVEKGTKDWFNHLLENNLPQDDSDDAKLKCLVKIVQLVRTDLQKAIEYYDKIFQEQVNFQYAKSLYGIYQQKLTELIKPDVEQVCNTMARMPHINYQTYNQVDTSQPLIIGTTLFELYLYIQRFVILGSGLCPAEYECFEIKNFFTWFYDGVAQWLNIAFYKALQRIDKAVLLDQMVPVDNTVKHSSSAIDSINIFYQVKTFWNELNWPDVEGCYTFIAKIIDDICRCLVHYAKQMARAVEGMGDKQDVYEKKFEVTQEWCLAINNIDFVLQALIPFTEQMGMDGIIDKLSDLNSPLEAQRCKQTLETVIANSVDTVKNEIFNLLDVVATKMCPSMKRLLVEGAELVRQDCNSIDRIMMYLDNNLHTLHDQLNEENFNRILDIIWSYMNEILLDLIQTNLEKRRPPSFFAYLLETLKQMKSAFNLNNNSECEELKNTERLLYLNGLETPDLIHQAHLDLWQEGKTTENSFGQLTVRLKFQANDLLVEILNAKNLIAMDSNGSSDSFIRVHILPEERFTNVAKPKTQIQHNTLFPLYDESFTLKLSPEQRNLPDGLVLFSCKDYDLLGYNNQYIGEALVHFKDIPNGSGSMDSLPQMTLELHRPKTLETDALKALEYRQGDKQAKEFIRRYKMRMALAKS